MRRITCTFVTGTVGLFILLLGLGFAAFGTRRLIKMWAWEKLTLKNGSEAMSRWIRPPHPIMFKVYIFNVTNPKEVSEGALPNLTEVGPYVYEQHREKVNLSQEENYTLSYRVKNVMHYSPSLSGQWRESDMVTVLNAPLAGAILSVYEAVPEFVGLMDDIWRLFFPGQTNIFITVSVRDLLFDGITIDCSSKITEVYIACRGLETKKTYSVRKEGKNFKFSFFHAKNGTSSHVYRVNRGILDLRKSAQLVSIDNSTLMKTWNNRYCNMINGSDGAQFPVLLKETDRLYIFEEELCRSVYAEFEKETNKNGVQLFKFTNTPGLFASSEENPDNSCFCRSPLGVMDVVQKEQDEQKERTENNTICFPKGVLPLMACLGSPIVASFPHFYMGDESYLNYSGLKPEKELHETFIYVEPNSGISVIGYKRIQFNLEVKRISDVQITSNLVDGLFPILWVEEGMELSTDFFKLMRYTLIQTKILKYGTFVLIGLGLFLIVISYVIQGMMDRSVCRGRKKLEGDVS